MNEPVSAQLSACDLEPIHIPGSIQPYGVMLIVNDQGVIVGYAGDAGNVLDQSLESVFGQSAAQVSAGLTDGAVRVVAGARLHGQNRDAIAYRSGEHLVPDEAADPPRNAVTLVHTKQWPVFAEWTAFRVRTVLQSEIVLAVDAKDYAKRNTTMNAVFIAAVLAVAVLAFFAVRRNAG